MAKDRALVLGGGGVVGVAWQLGLAAGLKEAGVDVTKADFILGTSAGAFSGAQLACRPDPAALAQAQIALGRAESAQAQDSNRPRPPEPDLAPYLRFYAERPIDRPPPTELVKKLGAIALGARTMQEEAFLRYFLILADGSSGWPERFACTAVDALSGEFKLWTRADGVPLASAVAASCSVPGALPPISIGDGKWMDGGVRSANNADLATGCRRVLVVAVTGGDEKDVRSTVLLRLLERERAAIEAAAGTSAVVTPDRASREAFGPNPMIPLNRAAVAEAGIAQGRREAEALRVFWN
jgi:NTE family protein